MAKKPKNTVSSQQPMFDGWDDDPNQAPPESGSDAGITSAIRPDNAISLTSEYSATAETTSPYPGTEKVSQVTISAAPVDPAERYQMPDLTDQLVIVVDSHSLIYQVFHALPPMTSPQGEPVGALHGFLGDVIELVNRFQPKHLFCAFDKSETTFRNDLYPEYKSHRDPMPEELRQQLPVIHEVLPAFGTCVLELGGFEADDILATLAAKVEAAGGRCLLVTSDKDCRQLITDRVQIYNIRKHETFGKQELMDTWGITPEQVVDFQTLVGDSVDNIPGVPLIGPKLAQELLSKYQNLENVFANAHEVAGPKRRQNLIDGRQQAIVSRQLVELRKDVPCEFDWYASRPSSCDLQRIEQLCQRWGFRRLRERATEILGRHATQALPAKVEIPWDLQYPLVRRREELQILADACRKAKRIAIDTETTSTSPRGSDLVGISIAWAEGKATYIPWLGPPGSELVDRDAFHELLAPVLADPAIEKVGQNIKFDLIVLRTAGIDVRGVTFDTMVADYLLDPGQRNHSLDEMSKRYLGHEMIPIERLIGTGRNQKKMNEVALPVICEYAAEDADATLRLACMLPDRLDDVGLGELNRTVEMPLIEVLTDLEYAGIYVDVQRLKGLSDTFTKELEAINAEIQKLAGGELNPDSPKQLAEVLFQRLGLRVVKRTKTGPSTDAEVLQALADEHPLPALLLKYRQLTKLKNTYVDSLPELVNSRTGRVHTSFRQDVAATGRLSSTEPNLQNIPIRTEEGRAIRSAFRAGEPGWLLLSADYSQIELRVLAHYCRDPALIDAYQKDQDIHARVAAEVFKVAEQDVTSDMRRTAKTINFGIVYGQSPFGLAKTLGIEKSAAAEYIREYFARYPGVLEFMKATLVKCRREGYVQTMLGRRRYVTGVRDFSNWDDASQWTLTEPERIGVNTVIQGSAADLIKLAMIQVQRRLKTDAAGLRARMLLQIHDELLFEVDPADAAELEELVRHEMVNARELLVPLKVEIGTGISWADT